MSKPVEIEFLMRDKLTGGVQNASKSVDGLGRTADATTRKVDTMGKTTTTAGTAGVKPATKSVDGLGRTVDATTRKINTMGKSAQTQGGQIESMFKRAAVGAAAFLGAQQVASFGKDVIDVRGQRQLLEQSFEVLLGSREKMQTMVGEIIELAIESPLEMTPVAKGAQTLMGFGVAAENVMPVLRQLSDVSMGNQQRFESLALVYAQTQAAGRLMGQDLLQYVNAGFNPLMVISEQTGKSLKVLREEMSDGAISAEMVADAFTSVTSASGKYYQMTQKQASGIVGQRATFEDAIVQMKNNIGEANEEMITSGYQVGTMLVNNYENIGRALAVLIATYGTYRAALILTAATKKMTMLADNIKLIMMMRKEIGLLTAAQQAFNLKAMANPYVLLASVIVGAGVALWGFIDAKREQEKAITEALKPMRTELTQTNLLVNKLKDANLKSTERKEILEELKKINPEITKGITDEAKAYEILSARLEEYNKTQLAEMAVKKFSLTTDFDSVVKELDDANNAVKEKSADLIDIYSTLFIRFKDLEQDNSSLPESFKTLLDSIFNSSIPETEKVQKLFDLLNELQNKGTVRLDYSWEEGRSVYDFYEGLSTSGYDNAVRQLEVLTGDYEEQAGEFKAKIQAIANAVFHNDEEGKVEFINSQMLQHLPKEFKDVEAAAGDASKAVRTWKTDLSELVSDDYKPKIEATTNVPEVIDVIQKAIKSEQDRVNSMKPLLLKAGFDFSAMSFPAGASPSLLEQQWAEDFIKAQNNLTGLNKAQSNFKIPDGKKSGDAVTKKLQTQIDLTKSAKEEYAQLLQFMSSDDAFKALESVSGYSSVKLEDIVSTKGENAGYIAYLDSQIKVLSNRKTDEAKSLVVKLQKELDGLKLENIYNNLSRASETTNLNKEYEKTVLDQATQSQHDIRQGEIDAMDEGFDKEIANIAHNYARLIAENTAREKEWVDELTKTEKAKWLLSNPDKDESQFTKKFTTSDLSTEQQTVLGGHATANKEYKEKSEADLLKSLLEQYQTYAQERKAIEETFNKDIKALKDANADSSNDGNISEAERLRDEALVALDTEVASRTTNFDAWADRILNTGLKKLKEALTTAETTLEKDGGKLSANEKAKLRAQIAALKAQIKVKNDDDAQDKASDKSKKKWGDTLEIMNDVNDSVGGIIDSFDGLDDSTKSVLSAATNIAGGTIAMIMGIQALSAGAAEGIKAVEKASIILAIIGAAMQILTALFSNKAEEEHQEALAKATEEKINMQREYNKLIIEQLMLMKEAENAFGEDSLAQVTGYFAAYKKANAEFKTEMQGEPPKMNWLERMTGDAFGSYKKRMKEYQDGVGGLSNMTIKTGSYTTGAWFWKKQHDVMNGVLDVYPDLVSAEGEFNVERAKAILATHEMSDANKQLLQSLVDNHEAMEQAKEELRSYIAETFGDIGSGLGDSIVDAFEQGTDAKDAWAGSFSDTLKNLAKQLMQTLFFKKHFDVLEKDLVNIYDKHGDDPDKVGSEVTQLLGGFFGSMGGVVDEASDWYKEFAEQAKKHGFDLSGDDSVTQSGQAGGFSTMSQDTGTKLDGTFTAMHMTSASIDERLANINVTIYSMSETLTEIATNTKDSVTELKKVVTLLTEQKRDGLKVK